MYSTRRATRVAYGQGAVGSPGGRGPRPSSLGDSHSAGRLTGRLLASVEYNTVLYNMI